MNLDRRVRTSLISIGCDLILISTKAALAAVTGSLAIAADALHSLSDLAVSGLVLFGIFLQRRAPALSPALDGGATTEPTADGAGQEAGAVGPSPRARKLEAGIAYAVSLVILYVPYEIVTNIGPRRGEPMRHLGLAIGGVLFCIALAYFISRLKLMVGRETDSPALTADGYHSRMDMLTSIAVLFSVMGQAIGIHLDPVVAVIIAVLIGITGVELLVSSVRALFGGSELRVDSLETWLHARLDQALGGASLRLLRRRISLPSPALAGAPHSLRPSKRLALGAGVLAVAAWLSTGLDAIGPDELGIRTRFGAIVGERLEPGLHFGLPRPIDRVHRTRPGLIERIEIGFRSGPGLAAGEAPLLWKASPARHDYRKVPEESLLLAGDENLVDLNVVVQYRTRDAATPLFRVNRLDAALRGLAESSLREVLATEPMDALLSGDRQRVLDRVRVLLSTQADRLKLGVDVVAVLCHDVHPPLEVVPAFRDVFSAREDQLKLLNQAESYQNQALPIARGKSAARLTDAEAGAADGQARAEGDAQRFALNALAYRTAPGTTGFRLFIESAEANLAGRTKIIASPRANRGGYQTWLYAPDFSPAPTPPTLPTRPLSPPPHPSEEE